MTPTAVTSAILQEPPLFAGIPLRPFTLAQHLFLQFIQSPILGDGPCKLHDVARALVVMSRPVRTSRDLWFAPAPAEAMPPFPGEPGDEALPHSAAFDAVAWELADEISFVDVLKAGEFLRQHIDRGFATAVPMRFPDGEGERPKEIADTQKVSAGNSH